MLDAPECLVRKMTVIGGRGKNIDTFIEVGARVLDAFLFLTECNDHRESAVTDNAPGLLHLTPHSALVSGIEVRLDVNRCQKVEPEGGSGVEGQSLVTPEAHLLTQRHLVIICWTVGNWCPRCFSC